MTEQEMVVPRHVGYIVDGNRRWAKKHGLPTYEGHLAGYNALKDVAFATLDAGVEYMSIYIFSTENWNRSQEEIGNLMKLVLRLFTTDAKIFDDYNIRLKVLGEREGLDPKIVKAILQLEEKTKHNTAGTLAICLNYGGQREIVDAVKKIVQSGAKAEEIDANLIAENLYGAEVPPVDVIVRTSGEKRLSNFMLWRAAYSEFIFLNKQFPEMTKEDVTAIIEEYSRRHRRFGG
ncbi:di-trans,poly-cis-decaprenylcistransferase [Candidatus Saccharibacteria bacterium]|nr:di-trans,poly-cis-decaprenylcistransferase [Candidatus Saccharibacteria bacterium]MBJ58636.1 di-trans,poly-cis-decaprenylcistransferase [Candidatus Saccharibacteria bacterium]MBQ68554.1 di-trans,poly-cis-decaprenylcistransferase [Candidatus Saccharibacteria bacterium]|tara:strand:+ start:253 stop:951 length:699 start_codon:yes stop_codon:yes gene_type:complete